MTQERSSDPTIKVYHYTFIGPPYVYHYSFQDKVMLTWKGSEREYRSTLGLITSLELSSNNFNGAVPEEIMDLVGLVALNLSRNHLTGQNSPKIGCLHSLLTPRLKLSQSPLLYPTPNPFSDAPVSLSHKAGLLLSETDSMSYSPTLFLWKLQNFSSASDSNLPKVTALENLIKIWQPFAIPSLLFINLVSFG
ncbi:hypothetical protein WN944_025040 [Citrus x changshan-huyou]|uniref:Uncharacterized protein n=1 Tax=Citrus x changshan-huyou TaxID=2935761 RepID=A0AAP0LP18_9ROSI